MNQVVTIIGGGLLAQLVSDTLAGHGGIVTLTQPGSSAPAGASLVLLLSDDTEDASWLAAEEALHHGSIPWLCGGIAGDEAVIGPLVRPGSHGCGHCSEHRRKLAGHDSEEKLELLMSRLLRPGSAASKTYASRTGLQQAANLIAMETQRIWEGQPAQTERSLYLLNLRTLQASLHPLLPNPLCPICGNLPEDSAEAARIELQPSPKLQPGSFRSRPLDSLQPLLKRPYVDERTGLFNSRQDDKEAPFASSVVNLPLEMGRDEITGGRAHTFPESRLTAVLEGLERYCGVSPRGKRTVVHSSYRALAGQALDPSTVGIYSQEQYAQPDFPFEPFNDDRTIPWVWGYSLTAERPLLLPERFAYYSLDNDGGFVNETSNGCAVGGSLAEAILHGLLEVVERDSFLMTWYARLSVPRIDLRSTGDQELMLMADRLHTVTGFELQVFNTTMEHGIPSVWAIAKNTRAEGMNLLCGAGAHLDPVKAIKNAVHELGGLLLALNESFMADPERAEELLHDRELVQQMADHSLLYGLPEAEERLHFLLQGDRVQTISEAFRSWPAHKDLTEDVRELIQLFRGLKLEVIVVDQTTPEMRSQGLCGVKVIIPGMLPMTFGQHLVRLTGLDRVLTVPVLLGYAQEPLSAGQLNPHPHPFP
ncbi:TOMM precursor leader peptide-binding protein [Paenibacillus filicis]|uniref:TOMM leader peptide-binding protein n=1 Tax=Paenibacillus filicis TaxID=669464 RepID=A0ABU9DWW3_9BACL